METKAVRTGLVITLCDLAMMSLAIGVNMLPVFLTTLSAELGGLSDEQLGRIGAVTFAGLTGGILLTGPLADRYGARPFAVGGNIAIAIGLVMLWMARDYPMILLGSTVLGLGAGVLDMVLSPIVSALQTHRRMLAMNLLHSFYCTGAVVTVVVGSLTIKYGATWREASAMLMILPIVLAGAFLVVRLPPLVHEDHVRVPLTTLVRQRYFVALLAAIFLGGATEMGLAYWLPAHAEKTLGVDRWTSGLGLAGFSLAMALGRIGILFIPSRIGPVTVMLACCAVTVILFPIGAFMMPAWVALSACILAGLSGSCLWPSTLAVAADRYPAGGATMFALLAALGNLGGICMPWLVGVIADRSTLPIGLATTALCPALMIVALLYIRAHRMHGADH